MSEHKTIEMFDSEGNFSILLTMQISRYAKETEMAVREVINRMKSAGASVGTWCFWSLSGYESFKMKMKIIEESPEDSE